MKYVPKSISRAVGTTVRKTQFKSPTILFAAGLVGVVGATILACKATLEVEGVLVDHEKEILNVNRSENRSAFSENLAEQERRHITLHTAGRLCKLYAPSVIVMGVSVVCLTKSHRMMADRNAQLAAAYVSLQKFLENYRGRVREKVGADQEQDIYYSSTPVELVEDTKNGPKKVFGSAPGQRSPYSGLFDEQNTNWQENETFNRHFLNIQEHNLTDKLRAQGSLMLNEVYDRLDMPRTPTGAVCGWVVGHPDSDDFVEFKVLPLHDFHGTLMVDFNVAGDVHHMLSGRASGR